MIPRRRTKPLGIRESERVRSPGHLQFVRGFVCVAFASGECSGDIEAHHVREDGNAGMGIKPGDDSAVSLCALHHHNLHANGRQTFEARHKVDLDKEALKLWLASSHRIKWERRR